MNKKIIYIVLTQTNSTISKMIKYFSCDKYSHISISFDKNCKKMYSFGRKYMYFPMIGVFKEENICKGLFIKKDNALISIYKIEVSNYVYHKIKKNIERIKNDNKGYNIMGLLLAYYKVKLHRKKYYCSEFVYEVLSKSDVINKDTIIFKPEDFIREYNFDKVYEGFIKDYINLINS